MPVEAIATGCPVIGLGVGGILDSMTDQTAVFYEHATCEGLLKAISTFELREHEFVEADLRARASLFSKENFRIGFERMLMRVSQQALAAKRYPVRGSAVRAV